MRKTKKCCKLKRTLIVCLVLAVLAFIGWLVYYFFFADDPEELDNSLFREEDPKAEEKPEAAPADAEAAEDTAEEAEAEALPEA